MQKAGFLTTRLSCITTKYDLWRSFDNHQKTRLICSSVTLLFYSRIHSSMISSIIISLNTLKCRLTSHSVFLPTDKHRHMRMMHNIIADGPHDCTPYRALPPGSTYDQDRTLLLRYLTYNFTWLASLCPEFSFQLKK